MTRWRHPAWWMAALLMLAPPTFGAADRYRFAPEEPQLLKFRLYDIEAGLDAEQETEETTLMRSDRKSTYQRTFIAPTLSMSGSGSIYHPSFIRFQLAGEAAYGTGDEEFESTTTQSRNQVQHLERMRGRMDFFNGKPLRGYAYGSYGRNFRDYDFFTRSTVESTAYGAQSLYDVPALYATANYSHTDERSLDTTTPSESRQDLAGMSLRKDRSRGSSTLSYTTSNNEYSGSSADARTRSTDHNVAAADELRFGREERFALGNRATYSRRDGSDAPSDQYLLSSQLDAMHRPNLSSRYSIGYDRFEDPTLTTDALTGDASVSHTLYQSLYSSASAHAGQSRFDAAEDASDTTTMGAGLAETYRKQLGPSHALELSAGVAVEEVDQTTPSRAVNETHVFPRPPALEVVVLDLPNVDTESLVVTDTARVQQFTPGIDYQLFPRGSRTELRRIPGGRIPEGGAILASYDTTAGGASGRYRDTTESYGVRLDLWDRLWALYGRLNVTRNDAPDSLYVLETTRTFTGTELSFRHANLGAEREWYESQELDYVTTRFYQSIWASPDPYSSASLAFTQAFTDRENESEQESDYRITGRYRRSLTRRLWCSIQAGFDWRRGPGVDQDLVVARPTLGYRIGRTSIDAYYDYEHNLYLDNEERTRERLFSSVRRSF